MSNYILVLGESEVINNSKKLWYENNLEIAYAKSREIAVESMSKFNFVSIILTDNFLNNKTMETVRILKNNTNAPVIALSKRIITSSEIVKIKMNVDFFFKESDFTESYAELMLSLIFFYKRIKNNTPYYFNENPYITFNNIAIHRDSMRVYVNDEYVHIPKLTFKLMNMFVLKPFDMIKLDDITTELWNTSYDDSDLSRINSQIRNIRRIIKLDNATELVSSKKTGYRLIDASY